MRRNGWCPACIARPRLSREKAYVYERLFKQVSRRFSSAQQKRDTTKPKGKYRTAAHVPVLLSLLPLSAQIRPIRVPPRSIRAPPNHLTCLSSSSSTSPSASPASSP